MFKNTSGQKITVFAFDASTGLPKTGDAANITVYVSKDDGSVTSLADTTGTEADSTNAKGDYLFDLSQSETNADKLRFTGKSSTSNVVIVPQTIYTVPPAFPSLTIANNAANANVTHYGGTAGTFSGGRPEVNTTHAAGTAWGSGAITSGVFAAGAINAAAIADGAIDSATFAAETGLRPIRSSTAQAGASTTITLDASASGTDDFYNNAIIYITGGTGQGQARFISDYAGSTKVATVPTWATNPDNTSTFAILPFGSIPGATAPTAAEVADAVWDEARAGHVSAGSFGEGVASVQGNVTGNVGGSVGSVTGAVGSVTATVNTNLIQISGDSGAADNLEALLDGTGGVTLVATGITLTNPINANVTQISGDSAAADNCEAAFDGNTYNVGGGAIVAASVTAGVTLATSENIYHAAINLNLDATNDEYSISWFKNGILQTSGITSPLIQVIKRSDGSDLVASTAMTQIGSTGSYKYTETSNRISDGEGYLVKITATIDGSTRTWGKWVSRDS